ncbi:MAG: hypothetical protein WCI18_10050 [Pseudomonadota bacterium]
MSESEQEVAVDNIGQILLGSVNPELISNEVKVLPQTEKGMQKYLAITFVLLFVTAFAYCFFDFSKIPIGASIPLNRSSEISLKVPDSVRFIEPTSGKVIQDWGTYSARFQVEYTSSFRSVGWVGFVSDQGQTMLDLVTIGSSMATFDKGLAKTFPVLMTKPNLKDGYHMVIVLCTEALSLDSRPKFHEVEAFMRISSMGGRLPRSDCSAINFRI